MPDVEKGWADQPETVRNAIMASWNSGVPPISSALYGRWWQLETWLRSLVYIELRAAYNTASWADQLPSSAETRQASDEHFHYMETPDAEARLAYTDARGLCEVISKHWTLFGPSLLAKTVWPGRVEELLAIRNRIGHCRRPHADDLARLEQALRDLESGAFRAAAFFRERWRPERYAPTDPLAIAWALNEHDDAKRLVAHADSRYETTFELSYSRRPWVTEWDVNARITGKAGFIWHATWYFRGAGYVDLRRFWQDLRGWRDPIVLVSADSPHSIEISLPALDDPAVVGNAIGRCFDAALENWSRGPAPEKLYERWYEINADLDPRVHTLSPWTITPDPRYRLTYFSA